MAGFDGPHLAMLYDDDQTGVTDSAVGKPDALADGDGQEEELLVCLRSLALARDPRMRIRRTLAVDRLDQMEGLTHRAPAGAER